jgi:hypothetical protein
MVQNYKKIKQPVLFVRLFGSCGNFVCKNLFATKAVAILFLIFFLPQILIGKT